MSVYSSQALVPIGDAERWLRAVNRTRIGLAIDEHGKERVRTLAELSVRLGIQFRFFEEDQQHVFACGAVSGVAIGSGR